MNCWDGGAAKAASSGEADDGLSPKSTFFTTVAVPGEGGFWGCINPRQNPAPIRAAVNGESLLGTPSSPRPLSVGCSNPATPSISGSRAANSRRSARHAVRFTVPANRCAGRERATVLGTGSKRQASIPSRITPALHCLDDSNCRNRRKRTPTREQREPRKDRPTRHRIRSWCA